VEGQEVIQREAETRDGSEEVEGVMRAMPVVVVEEKRQAVGALSGRGIGVSVGPFAKRGLDEALGFAVGFWSVKTSEAVLEAEASDLGGESGGAIGRAIVGVETVDAEAEVGKEGERELEEGDDAASGFVRENGGKGEARVVVDGDVQILPARAARVVELAVAGDAMARADNAGQLLDVEVEEVARRGPFVAHHRWRRFERRETMEAVAAKNTADRGFGELGFGGDLKAWQLVPAEREDTSDAERVRGKRGRSRLGRAIRKTGPAFALEASEPLVNGAFRETESSGDGRHGLMEFKNTMDHLGSTQWGQPGLTVHVHAAVPFGWLV